LEKLADELNLIATRNGDASFNGVSSAKEALELLPGATKHVKEVKVILKSRLQTKIKTV
jgi:hypothetical protein